MTLQPEFLAVVSHRQFLARMLTNLKFIYLKQQELEKTLAAVERILLLIPNLTLELRGLIYISARLLPPSRRRLRKLFSKSS